jgi:hypothetical protein
MPKSTAVCPPGPFLFFAGQCLGDGVVWTIAVIASVAYEHGLITFATLVVGMILVAGAVCLIVAKTNPCREARDRRPGTWRVPQLAASFISSQAPSGIGTEPDQPDRSDDVRCSG